MDSRGSARGRWKPMGRRPYRYLKTCQVGLGAVGDSLGELLRRVNAECGDKMHLRDAREGGEKMGKN